MKNVISKMTGKRIEEIDGDTVCEVLDILAEYLSGKVLQSPIELNINFARKQVDGVGYVLLGYDGNIYASIQVGDSKLGTATSAVAKVTFTDVK